MSKKDNNRPPRKCTSELQKRAIRKSYAIRAAKKKEQKSVTGSKLPNSRTATGKVPQGRTLKTHDNYLPNNTGSNKERPLVVIEADEDNNLAVVPLSTQKGRNRTQLKNYQQGQSYFKHHVEINDNEGNPIRINEKFNENHPNMDVSRADVDTIIDTVFNHSVPMQANQKKINKFRDKKNPRN